MIDTHCHILWGIDDASSTYSESLDMLRVAAADGIRIIVATSHVKYPYYKNTLAILEREVAKVQVLIQEYSLDIEVVVGGENFVNHQTIQLLDEDKFVTYGNHGRYMLMEFAWTKNSFDDPTRYIKRVLDKGITPVIAHPERYEWVHENYSLIKSWRQMGCLMQINRTSIFGLDKIENANIFANKMLEDDLVDLVGSDAHRAYSPRLPKLSDVYSFVEKKYGKDRAELYLIRNPKMILEKEPTS